MEIRSMNSTDWPQVKAIYEAAIATGVATLETQAPSWAYWDSHHAAHSRWVATTDSQIIAWAALTPVSHRCVYGGVAEVSIYVGNGFRGKGVGKSLFKTLIESSEAEGIWTLESSIFEENVPSIRLHTSLGFRKVGFRERIAKFQGKWINTVIMERRSNLVGR